ncbi:hypothetical protein [Okeania sp. SIO3I5]|nr:hypothetical protein [Okeania sp. SIO3I5]
MFLVTGATGGLGCQIIKILTEKEMSVYSKLEKCRVGWAAIIIN